MLEIFLNSVTCTICREDLVDELRCCDLFLHTLCLFTSLISICASWLIVAISTLLKIDRCKKKKKVNLMLKLNIYSTSGKAEFVVDSEAKMGKVAKKEEG